MKFGQLHYFMPNLNKVADIRKSILFYRDRVSQLYARVRKLQDETINQSISHK